MLLSDSPKKLKPTIKVFSIIDDTLGQILEVRANKNEWRLFERDIGVCGVVVLVNFSCGISAILILNGDVTVFFKPVGCVSLAFWSTIALKRVLHLFPTIFSRFWSFRKQPVTVFTVLSHILIHNLTVLLNNQFKAVSLFPRSDRSLLPLFLPSCKRIRQLFRLTMNLRYFPEFFCGICRFFFTVQQPPMSPSFSTEWFIILLYFYPTLN